MRVLLICLALFLVMVFPLTAQAESEGSRLGYTELWPVHAILMGASFVLLSTGMLVARYMKKKRGWLKNHKWLQWFGAVGAVLAFAIAFYMLAAEGAGHIRFAHSIVGLITVISIILTPVIGYAILKGKRERKRAYRIFHRWIGRITLAGMIAAVILGLRFRGIL